ncbi:MAG: DNA-3-methyladenine glycosylase I [Eudoraea sp.]|nr:DNA-3-methyladenine glycosylase I [Eudoraea sp.]
MKKKCGWCLGDKLYEAYHDLEWGVPVRDDQTIFEFLILETFQAGLSWITILKKRENFRKAFDSFDYKKIARYDVSKIAILLQDAGIIRNQLKIKATISNARAFMEIQEEFGSFSKYIWSFVDGAPIQNRILNYKEGPSTSPISDALSKDLKKRGFKFVGSTVVYAHMQATGMVNDHETSCFRYKELCS